MALGHEAVLLPDLALEQVRLRVRRRERRDSRRPAARCGRRRACCRRRRRARPRAASPSPSGTPNQAHSRAPRSSSAAVAATSSAARPARAPPPRACWCRWSAGRMRAAALMARERAALAAAVQASRSTGGVARPEPQRDGRAAPAAAR